MRILVTGNEGFIGRNLVPLLVTLGHEVIGTENFAVFALSDEARKPFDVVIHLAANIVNVHARSAMGLNAFDDIVLDLDVLKFIERTTPDRVILMSSCAVDFQADPYCTVKRTLEIFAKRLVEKTEIEVVVLRPFSGYGVDQSEEYPFRAILERALRREDPLIVWGGGQVRDWIHVSDIVNGIVAAAIYDGVFPVDATPVELGTTVGTTIYCLAALIAEEVSQWVPSYKPKIETDAVKTVSSTRRVAAHTPKGWSPRIPLAVGVAQAVRARVEALK